MQTTLPAFSLLPLEDLIDCTPPTIGVEATIWDAIALMNQYQPALQYVLVVENCQNVGLFSWENFFQIAQSQVDLRNSKITEVMKTPAIKIKYSQLQDTKLILQLFVDLKEPILVENEKEQLYGYITPEAVASLLLKDYHSKISEAEQVSYKKQEIICSKTKITQCKQLKQDLKQALDKEKEVNELKSNFISMTSHEFRTPLSTILSSSELLENYRNKWNEEKQLKHFNRIKTAVNHMNSLLNDVLFFGKFQAEEVDCNPANLELVEYSRQLVEDVLINQTSKSPDRADVNINFITNQTILNAKIDDKTLGHILNNLLSNAVKYSLPGTSVNLTLYSQEKQAVFEIQDEGIGIPSEDLPSLFDSFHRCKNVGNIQGTGLGLSIVKKCVDMLKGEISVTSELGIGTKFTVFIPLKNCC